MEEKHALRVNLEMTVEELWNQFQQALKNYTETTEERRKAFEDLKAKDEKSAHEIEVQMRKLQNLSVRKYTVTLLSSSSCRLNAEAHRLPTYYSLKNSCKIFKLVV